MARPAAHAVIRRAAQSASPDPEAPGDGQTAAFFEAVERAAAALLDPRSQALLRGELEFELARSIGAPHGAARIDTETVSIRGEWDVSAARARVREVVTVLGGSSYDVVRAMTLVSELARNIVLYTPGGRIDFGPSHNPRGLVVRATDEGAGIANLDEVLSGRHRSSTGLGRGLIAAKRLAHRFQIETGPGGTRIEAHVRLG